MTAYESLKSSIQEVLAQRNISVRAAALMAGLPIRSVQNVIDGHDPRLSRAAEICEALDLELYIGPVRDNSEPVKAPTGPTHEVPSADVATLRDEVVALRDDVAATARRVIKRLDANVVSPDSRSVDVVELATAAGDGADVASETVTGRVWFRRAWLDEQGLDPTQCVVIGVMGESMYPALWDGSKILVNRARTEWRTGDIFVFRTGDGLIVKRAGEDRDGNRILISDNPEWPPLPLPADAEITGRVVWTARTLPGGSST